MKDKQKLQEDLQRKLARQHETLKETLDELAMLEDLQKKNPHVNYGATIAQLRSKRDRQASAVKATEQYLAALEQLAGKKR